MKESFWTYLDSIIQSTDIIIDRPKGSAHPRHESIVYPLDYGYLKGTSASDGNEIDVWRGSLAGKRIDAVICTVDLKKCDTEIKLLVGCTEQEKATIRDFHNDGEYMAGILIKREIA